MCINRNTWPLSLRCLSAAGSDRFTFQIWFIFSQINFFVQMKDETRHNISTKPFIWERLYKSKLSSIDFYQTHVLISYLMVDFLPNGFNWARVHRNGMIIIYTVTLYWMDGPLVNDFLVIGRLKNTFIVLN